MKRTYGILILLFISISACCQTKATNFNCSDCAGTNHDLFAELNSGKVIVLDWVMPCSSCVPPSKTAYNMVQNYGTTNPGKVLMYICDDAANTPCASLASWADINSMPNTVKFSNSLIKESDYGSSGMPKIVIIGGINHTVFFNEINTAAGDVNKLQAALIAATAAAGVSQKTLSVLSYISVNPNPATGNATLSVILNNPSVVSCEIFNSVGQKVVTILENEKFSQGKNEIEISTEALVDGIYFVKVSEPSGFKTLRLAVSH